MGKLKEQFYETALKASEEIKQIIKEHGETVVDSVTLSQVYQGMRGIIGLVTETSLLDANEGIRFRGFSIPELIEKLPHVEGGTQPLPEGLFHLMLIGEIPTENDVEHLSAVFWSSFTCS
jgi:citrate synthase